MLILGGSFIKHQPLKEQTICCSMNFSVFLFLKQSMAIMKYYTFYNLMAYLMLLKAFDIFTFG